MLLFKCIITVPALATFSQDDWDSVEGWPLTLEAVLPTMPSDGSESVSG